MGKTFQPDRAAVRIPLAGDFDFLSGGKRAVVEDAPCENEDIWKAYVGDPKSRLGRRAAIAAAAVLNNAAVSDRQVVDLLGILLMTSRPTPYRAQICNLFSRWKRVNAGIKSSVPLVADSPSWVALRGIIECKMPDPNSYPRTGRGFKDLVSDAQLAKLLSKYPFMGAETVARDTAINNLLKREEHNKETNVRWRDGSFDSEELSFIETVTVHLGAILGPAPLASEVLDNAAWGPGVLNGYPFHGQETGAEMKFGATQTCTPFLVPIAEQVIQQYPAWSRMFYDLGGAKSALTVLPGDELFTVNKKFELHRCAFKQPSLNAWLQRGVGVTIRKRLEKTGLKLTFQQAVNKTLARIGSMTGLYATIDLSEASDSICRAVLRSVLSPGWFAWLFSTAARSFKLPDAYCKDHNLRNVSRPYEMMSSMGCGFTFELETALFLAIARACVPAQYRTKVTSQDPNKPGTIGDHKLAGEYYPHVGVYGDDIIVPSAYAEKVIAGLKLFGLKINEAKSFTGRDPGFRESCGGDFFLGMPCRPKYLEQRLDNGSSIIATANRVLEMSHERAEALTGYDRYGDRDLRGLHTALVGYLPARVMPALLTPPGSTGGLWDHAMSRGETQTGRPARYRSFIPSKSEIDLRKSVFILSRERLPGERRTSPSSQMAVCLNANGYNLLAARLSNNRGDPSMNLREKWDVRVGLGEKSVRRSDGVRLIPGIVTQAAHPRWDGWC
jgi:hypothetical protein